MLDESLIDSSLGNLTIDLGLETPAETAARLVQLETADREAAIAELSDEELEPVTKLRAADIDGVRVLDQQVAMSAMLEECRQVWRSRKERKDHLHGRDRRLRTYPAEPITRARVVYALAILTELAANGKRLVGYRSDHEPSELIRKLAASLRDDGVDCTCGRRYHYGRQRGRCYCTDRLVSLRLNDFETTWLEDHGVEEVDTLFRDAKRLREDVQREVKRYERAQRPRRAQRVEQLHLLDLNKIEGEQRQREHEALRAQAAAEFRARRERNARIERQHMVDRIDTELADRGAEALDLDEETLAQDASLRERWRWETRETRWPEQFEPSDDVFWTDRRQAQVGTVAGRLGATTFAYFLFLLMTSNPSIVFAVVLFAIIQLPNTAFGLKTVNRRYPVAAASSKLRFDNRLTFDGALGTAVRRAEEALLEMQVVEASWRTRSATVDFGRDWRVDELLSCVWAAEAWHEAHRHATDAGADGWLELIDPEIEAIIDRLERLRGQVLAGVEDRTRDPEWPALLDAARAQLAELVEAANAPLVEAMDASSARAAAVQADLAAELKAVKAYAHAREVAEALPPAGQVAQSAG